MKSFSQRHGFALVPEIIQIDGINDKLRNSLWNVFDIFLWSASDRIRYRAVPTISDEAMRDFGNVLWFEHFKLPVDTRPFSRAEIVGEIRRYFFSCNWHEVYDFTEVVIKYFKSKVTQLEEYCNTVLTRELSGYRVISGIVVPIVDETEVEMLTESLRDTPFSGEKTHLTQALYHLASRENPDYRNSIKESVSAVEHVARIVAKSPNATLGDALKKLNKNGLLHPALERSFSALYGYTNDAEGIRHALSAKSEVTLADARFFLLSCTSFANYLKTLIDNS